MDCGKIVQLHRLYIIFFISSLFVLGYQKNTFAAHNIPSGTTLSLYAGVSNAETRVNRMILSALETDIFNGDKYSNKYLLGGGVAFPYIQEKNRTIRFGLDIFHLEHLKNTGRVLQYDLPAFDNYHYKLDVKSTRVILTNEWDFSTPFKHFEIFAKGGVGLAVNRVGYQDNPITPTPDGGIHLSNKKNNELAYDIGGGIHIPFSKNISGTLQYQYADLGDFESSRSGNIVLLKPLHVKLRTQSIIAGINYTIS